MNRRPNGRTSTGASSSGKTREFGSRIRRFESSRPSQSLPITGGMAEWFKAAVLKTVDRKVRGFESLSLRQQPVDIVHPPTTLVFSKSSGRAHCYLLAPCPSGLTTTVLCPHEVRRTSSILAANQSMSFARYPVSNRPVELLENLVRCPSNSFLNA